jgi:hypothetical protein
MSARQEYKATPLANWASGLTAEQVVDELSAEGSRSPGAEGLGAKAGCAPPGARPPAPSSLVVYGH